MFQLIGIHGKARSGKDTVAKYLVERHGFMRNAFADPLKLAAKQMFCLTDAQTWQDDMKEVVIPYWGRSPRQIFQLLGTEGGRQVFGEDLWLRRWNYHYEQFGPVCNYVTPDVRFGNEADLIRNLGGRLIHLQSNRNHAGLADMTKLHASEQGLRVLPDDFVIDNSGSFNDLYNAIDELMERFANGDYARG